MCSNIKRGILTGVLLWALIFFEVSILMFGFKLEGLSYYIIHYVLLAVLASISAMIYFKGKKIKRSAKEGFYLGILLVVTAVVLDSVITIPLFVKSYSFFLDPYLVAGLIETVIVSTIFGAVKK